MYQRDVLGSKKDKQNLLRFRSKTTEKLSCFSRQSAASEGALKKTYKLEHLAIIANEIR